MRYILILFISYFSFGQNIEILHTNGKFILDDSLKLIVSNIDINSYQNLQNIDSLKIKLNNTKYEFNSIPNKIEYGKQYLVNTNSTTYKLYFSNIPLINIYINEEIVDEPKKSGLLFLSDNISDELIISYCGIELRGASGQLSPKKSYDIELWEDKQGYNNNKIPLLNMRNDDDWLLLGLYNEPLRLRNVVSHEIWNQIHQPYYIQEEEGAMSGIRTQYVELAINKEYLGVYALCEQVDRKQLQIKEFINSINGELYKGFSWGATTYSDLPSYNNNQNNWGGFELKYPKESDIIDWHNLYNWIDFVINSTDLDFEENVAKKFVLNNAIDYFIFINLIRANDNTGKNIFIAKYEENEPYFYVPWDLDGVLGTMYTGEKENIYNDILKNLLYERLLVADKNLFNIQLSNRWFQLRNNILDKGELMNLIITKYSLLLENANYEKEVLKWGDESIDFENIQYTSEWLNNRIEFLDNYFGSKNFPAISINRKLIQTIDILGREANSKGFNIEIYDDGSVQKKYVIE